MRKPSSSPPSAPSVVVNRVRRTSDGLREALFHQLDLLGAGIGDWNRARVMAQVSAQIISAAYLDLEYARRGIGEVKTINLVTEESGE
jgi:hypothetical protein